MSDELRIYLAIGSFTLFAGILDSFAFTYSATVWDNGKLLWGQASKAAGTFALGILMYWCAIRYLGQVGIVLPEVQTLIWFTVTILGVATIGGRVIHWPVLDQVVAANVFVSLGWLITRTAE